MNPEDGITRILNLDTQRLDRAAELDRLRRNITLLFTDIKGSTAYFERFGDAAGLIMVHRCNTLLSQAVQRHGGRVIKTIGDAIMAAFEGATGFEPEPLSGRERGRTLSAAKRKDERESAAEILSERAARVEGPLPP